MNDQQYPTNPDFRPASTDLEAEYAKTRIEGVEPSPEVPEDAEEVLTPRSVPRKATKAEEPEEPKGEEAAAHEEKGALPVSDEPEAADKEPERHEPDSRKLDTEKQKLEEEQKGERVAFEKAMRKLADTVKARRTALKRKIENEKLNPRDPADREKIDAYAETEAEEVVRTFDDHRERFLIVKHLLRGINVPGAQTVDEKVETIALIGLKKLEIWDTKNFLHRVERKVGSKMTKLMEQEWGNELKELLERLETEAPEMFSEEEVGAEVA